MQNHDFRRIVLICITTIVGILLLYIMYISYKNKPKEDSGASTKIKDFYNTILEKGQFIFDSK